MNSILPQLGKAATGESREKEEGEEQAEFSGCKREHETENKW